LAQVQECMDQYEPPHAAFVAHDLAEQFPEEVEAQMSFVSVFLQTCVGMMQEDEELVAKVSAALEFCLKSLTAKQGVGSLSEEEKSQLAHIFYLQGKLLLEVTKNPPSALEFFEKSLDLVPNNPGVFFGQAFAHAAMQNPDAEAECYKKVLSCHENHLQALTNLAAVLVTKARTASDADCAAFIEQAKELLIRADNEGPGYPAYNLACALSTFASRLTERNEQQAAVLEECRVWLNKARDSGVISQLYELLEQDEDLDFVRNLDWFKTLQENIKQTFVVEFCEEELLVAPPDGSVCSEINVQSLSVNDKEANMSDATAMETVESSQGDTQAKGGVVGTTGWTIWNSSFTTIRFLEKRYNTEGSAHWGGQDWWASRKVLDLSAGLGLAGIACSSLGAQVVMTDVGEKQIRTLERNAKINGLEITCEDLAWGEDTALANLVERHGPFDLVLACDLLYIGIRDRIMPKLLSTLKTLVQHSGRVMLSYESRQPAQEQSAIEELESLFHLIHHPVNVAAVMKAQYRGFNEIEEESIFSGLKIHEDPDLRMIEIMKR